MKKIVLALVAAITMSATAVAQDENKQKRDRQQPDRTEMVKQRTAETVKTYGLNDTQAAKLLELNLQYADKMGPMGGPQRGGRDGRRPQVNRGDRQQGDTLRAGGQQQRQRPSREDMEKRREEMKKQMEAYNAELQKIMTEDQYKAYQADAQKRMQQGPRGGRQGQRQRPSRNND
ncbi:MAG: DUF4890 domain-containing protein [Prevotella sp.]|nr:DUF4890 domain-containing protein [Prevotella sp.]